MSNKTGTIKEWGEQSYDRRLRETILQNKGLNGVKRNEERKGRNPTPREVEQSIANGLQINPVTRTTAPNEAEKAYKGKVNQEQEDFTIGGAIDRVQRRNERIGAKMNCGALCDIDTAKRLVWESYKSFAIRRNFNPVFSDQLKEVISMLTAYFTGNETPLDRNKGIYLWGPCGTGKSILFKVIQTVLVEFKYPMRYNMKSVPDLFNGALANSNVNFAKYYQSNYCFDDLGFDSNQIKHFGNTVNPMQIIMSARYLNFQSHGIITHATSNLPWSGADESMTSRFDDRIMSRGSEMFNFVKLGGDDLRKGKQYKRHV